MATNTPRPTKAAMLQLEARAQAAEARTEAIVRELEQARADAADWRAARIVDGEAEALSGCVRAIEGMLEIGTRNVGVGAERSLYGRLHYGPEVPTPPEGTPVGRILLSLAYRYGVPLEGRQPEPQDDNAPVTVTVPARVARHLQETGQL